MKRKVLILCIVLVFVAGCGLFLLPRDEQAKQSSAAAPKKVEKSAAEKALEAMSLKEKIGQMFLVCVPHSQVNPEDIEAYHPGGYLFFTDFFQNRDKDAVSADIASYQKAAATPMLMAVDEEGGAVVRVSKFPAFRSQPFSSPQQCYKQGGLEAVLEQEGEKADLLLSLGINVNLAPVCDMTEDTHSFIYLRTLGQDPKTTADCISATVSLMNSKKIGSALKHFPGYGGNADTHTGIVHDTRPYEAFTEKDFLPFQSGIAAGAPCVLVSHNIVESMDPNTPASLSKPVHEILRNDLGFDGVILTDDLNMQGVQGYSGGENIAVAAIQSGNDLLCTYDYKEQIPAVMEAVKSGKISKEQIGSSALRILKWKEQLGLLSSDRLKNQNQSENQEQSKNKGQAKSKN